MVKVSQMLWLVAIFAVAMVATIALVLNSGQKEMTIVGGVTNAEGELVGPWSNTVVNYMLITSDRFTGADVDAVAKVYDEKPEDWVNPRGDFTDASKYTVYTGSSGEVLINKEMPGTYYVVLTATGYNTEFIEITIPDGTGRGDLSDYQANPDRLPVEMTKIGTTTASTIDFALTNASGKELKDTELLTIDDNTEFRGWKVIINDELGFSVDTDGDGNYDEGIDYMKVTIGDKSVVVFDPARAVDEFDSNDEYTLNIEGTKLADGEDLVVKVEFKADTSDTAGANDEKLGEGDGTISYIKIYDMEGNLFATVPIVA